MDESELQSSAEQTQGEIQEKSLFLSQKTETHDDFIKSVKELE